MSTRGSAQCNRTFKRQLWDKYLSRYISEANIHMIGHTSSSCLLVSLIAIQEMKHGVLVALII